MHHSDFNAHQSLTSRASWMQPAPVRAKRRAGLLVALLAALGLVACGGGAESAADDTARIQQCHPDTFDCMAMYGAEYSHTWRVVSTENLLFTNSAEEPTGFGNVEFVR